MVSNTDFAFLQQRVDELDKEINAIKTQMQTVVTTTQVARLITVQESRLKDLETKMDRLIVMFDNYMKSSN